MAITKEVHVTVTASCDNCENYLQSPVEAGFIQAIESQGWTVLESGKCYCPNCKVTHPE
jgi:hypothetical protein